MRTASGGDHTRRAEWKREDTGENMNHKNDKHDDDDGDDDDLRHHEELEGKCGEGWGGFLANCACERFDMSDV